MKKHYGKYKIVSLLLVSMLLVISAGSGYAGPPPFFHVSDAEHPRDIAEQQSPGAFIQKEKPHVFGRSMWKGHGHYSAHNNGLKPQSLASDAPVNFMQRALGRMFSVLNIESQRLLPASRYTISQGARYGGACIPEESVEILQFPRCSPNTSDAATKAANHQLHQFQILLI